MKNKKYRIENRLFKKYLEPGEHIEYVIHLHFLCYHLKLTTVKVFFFGLPILLILFLPILFPLAMLLFGIGLIRMAFLYFDWNYNVWLVTNKGIVTIRAKNLWHRNSSRVEHDMVAGVTYEISGFAASVLNYGKLTLEKSGNSIVMLSMENVSKPRKAELMIIKHQKAYMRNKESHTDTGLLKLLMKKLHFTQLTHAEAAKLASVPKLNF